MQRSNDQPEEEKCSICLDDLRKYGSSKFARAACCGKGMHIKCREGVSHKQKDQCVMCRTKYPDSDKEAIEQLRPWVEKGKAWAQYNLGNMYSKGHGVDQSYGRAKEYYDLAASQGEATAQYTLGVMYDQGQGVDQNYKRAAEYYEAAASQGHADAQSNLGALYGKGQGVEQSLEIARELWLKAAEQGNEQAINGLQLLDEHEGRTTPSFAPPKRCSLCDTPETSTHKLNDCPCFGAQYCNAKCQTSQWKLHKKEHRRLCKEMPQQEEEEDVCPVCIEALQKDQTKFIRFTCCGKGIHKWCYEGIQVSSLSDKQKNQCVLCRTKNPKSEEERVEQIRPWVEKGKAWAQSMLGCWYRDGVGVEQSYQQARELLELAASQGVADAQYNLGHMYENGQGVDQSYERAAEYYEAAARQGNASAQSNLCGLYIKGQGVEQSIETARAWSMKAAEQGSQSAILGLQMLDEIEGRTTPSFVPKPLECASCYRPHDPSEHKLRPCNGCHRVFYCGKECQKEHWKRERNGHKQRCNKKAK